MRKGLLGLLWSLLGVGIGVLIFAGQPRAHALPEYATRTGEPCATCHVNPAGGGPRTARSALWIAQGRPDHVPELPGTAPANDSAPGDGRTLYGKFGCAGCHGDAGQGASGPALTLPGANKAADSVIRNGRGTMLAYPPDRLAEADLALILEFVQSLATDKAQEAAASAPRTRRPAEFACGGAPAGEGAVGAAAAGLLGVSSCGGN